MAFVTGMMLIETPAAALNNSGRDENARIDTATAVKFIAAGAGRIPYVSAQAVRFWIRDYLARRNGEWKAAPTYKENENLAYTAANPIEYWDDDLFGYMRAPTSATRGKRKEDPEYLKLTPLAEQKGRDGKLREANVTRISPFRSGTLVGLGPVRIVEDWGTMARHNGDPVLHQHQFYRATLQGLMSLDLSTAGTFFNGGRVGYRNLDEVRVKLAVEQKLLEVSVHGQPAFRLPNPERTRRVATLVKAFGELEGGAKLTLHYTDVTPGLLICAVLKAGNNPFARIVRPNAQSDPEVIIDTLKEVLHVYKDQILSEVFVGWAKGYLDDQRKKVEELSKDDLSGVELRWGHPREMMAQLAAELSKEGNDSWYD